MAMHEMLMLSVEERKRLATAARQRIEANYSLPTVVAHYQDLYEEVVAQYVE